MIKKTTRTNVRLMDGVDATLDGEGSITPGTAETCLSTGNGTMGRNQRVRGAQKTIDPGTVRREEGGPLTRPYKRRGMVAVPSVEDQRPQRDSVGDGHTLEPV